MTVAANEVKTQERRRSQRIPFRVPILVEGRTVDGKPFEERTHTHEINRHGARIVLQANPQPGGRITVTNLQTKSKCHFQVVSRPGKPMDKEKGIDQGIECLNPLIDFWGISFPQIEEPTGNQGMIDILLECSKCRSREPAQVTQAQYQRIVAHSSVSRSCRECEAITEWGVVYPHGDSQGGESLPPSPALPTAPPLKAREPRREKRMTMRLPVRIRLEDIGETENLSPNGLCFNSELALRVGDRVWLTVGYAPGGNEKEVAARIVWSKGLDGGKRAIYGVQIEHDK
jgi:hypothetical protein